MEDFKLLMDKTIAIFSRTVSIWGYSFSFLEVVLFAVVASIAIRVVAAFMFDE